MRITLRVDPRATFRVLDGLMADFGRSGPSVRRAVRATLEPVLEELRANTPVETGALRRSARLEISVAGGVLSARVGWSGRKVRRQQMLAVEFGTRTRPAGRVLSRAVESAGIQAAIAAHLRRELDARLARSGA